MTYERSGLKARFQKMGSVFSCFLISSDLLYPILQQQSTQFFLKHLDLHLVTATKAKRFIMFGGLKASSIMDRHRYRLTIPQTPVQLKWSEGSTSAGDLAAAPSNLALETVGRDTFLNALNMSYTGHGRLDYNQSLPSSPIMFWTKAEIGVLREVAKLLPEICRDIKILDYITEPRQTEYYVNELKLLSTESLRQRNEEYKRSLQKDFEYGRRTIWNSHEVPAMPAPKETGFGFISPPPGFPTDSKAKLENRAVGGPPASLHSPRAESFPSASPEPTPNNCSLAMQELHSRLTSSKTMNPSSVRTPPGFSPLPPRQCPAQEDSDPTFKRLRQEVDMYAVPGYGVGSLPDISTTSGLFGEDYRGGSILLDALWAIEQDGESSELGSDEYETVDEEEEVSEDQSFHDEYQVFNQGGVPYYTADMAYGWPLSGISPKANENCEDIYGNFSIVNSSIGRYEAVVPLSFLETSASPPQMIPRDAGHYYPTGTVPLRSSFSCDDAQRLSPVQMLNPIPILSPPNLSPTRNQEPDERREHASSSNLAYQGLELSEENFPKLPETGFTSSPLDGFSSTPTAGFNSSPLSGFNFNSCPTAGFRSGPILGFNFNGSPIPCFGSSPHCGFSSSPNGGFTSIPLVGFTSNPLAGFTSSPLAGFTSSPLAGFTSSPLAGFTSSPIMAGFYSGPITGSNTSPIASLNSSPINTSRVLVLDEEHFPSLPGSTSFNSGPIYSFNWNSIAPVGGFNSGGFQSQSSSTVVSPRTNSQSLDEDDNDYSDISEEEEDDYEPEHPILEINSSRYRTFKGVSTNTHRLPTNSRRRRNYLCVFCKGNNEPEDVYKSHPIRVNGIVMCPFLRNHVCAICKSTGDRAHTIKYCPQNRRGFFAQKALEKSKSLPDASALLKMEMKRSTLIFTQSPRLGSAGGPRLSVTAPGTLPTQQTNEKENDEPVPTPLRKPMLKEVIDFDSNYTGTVFMVKKTTEVAGGQKQPINRLARKGRGGRKRRNYLNNCKD